MLKKFVTCSVAIAALCCSVTALANSNAYNKGFLAAESGDYQSAMKSWGPAAEKGDALAQFNIATLYHSGSGLPHNEAEAVKWYIKSAENGYSLAQEYLAAAYREGWFGLKKDAKKAKYWENKLAQSQ